MKTRIKENTWATKEHIIRTKLLPYFGNLKMSSINAQQIMDTAYVELKFADGSMSAMTPSWWRMRLLTIGISDLN